MRIAGRQIGAGNPVYVVAEISANHNQKFEYASRLVHAAKEAGADAVKLQTYTPETITIPCDSSHFQIAGGTLWGGRSLYELYKEASMPWEWQPKLKAIADELDITLFSSAFDPTAVDFLERMDVPAHKVASCELVDIPLIEKMARTGKPLILSTGMATLDEINEAMEAAREAGGRDVLLLKCTSAYPGQPEDMNLRTIPEMSRLFGVPVGLSDHTLGVSVPVAAVTLGACMVEKHLTLSRELAGPDSAFSVEPHEFAEMVESVRTAERALGKIQFGPARSEETSRAFRRSLFVVRDINAGERFTPDNVKSIRPASGLHTRYLSHVLGQRASQDIRRGTPLSWSLIAMEAAA